MARFGREVAEPGPGVLEWLLDSDPSIRWQVMRDLTGEAAPAVARERARVATAGWGARLLDLQEADGDWGGGAWVYRSWASTLETLMLLRELGLDPESERARRAIDLVRAHSRFGAEHGHSPFFEGEVEPCINGRVLACGAYFGVADEGVADEGVADEGLAGEGLVSERLLERLLSEQLADGGWNCDAPPSTRSSFNTTICVLEGLWEYERGHGGGSAVRDARLRGEAYLLDRGLMRSLSTGAVIERDRKSGGSWTELSFPTRWHYNVLWGLDYLRRSGATPDERVADAVAVVAEKRDDAGRWALGQPHAGTVHFELGRRRGDAEPVEHAAGAAGPRLVRPLGGFPDPSGSLNGVRGRCSRRRDRDRESGSGRWTWS